MKYTLTIDKPTKKILALMNLIRSYDEITLEEESSNFELSDEQKKELDIRAEKHSKGLGTNYSWDEVKNKVRSSK